MRKSFNSIDVLGIQGIFIWLVVVLLRRTNIVGGELCTFLLGVLPNLGAAWLVTAIIKNLVVKIMKENYTIAAHSINCITILLIALCSEFFFFIVYGRAFDYADIVVTAIAQVIIFLLPIALNQLDRRAEE